MADGTETEDVTIPGDEGHQSASEQDTQKPDSGNQQEAAASPFADLDEDTREWLTKREIKDLKGAAKLAHEQSKLLGNAIRVPGKDATAEEVEAYLNKLGRPETTDGYEFRPPEGLPEDLPYDGERAKSFAGLAHKVGLTKQQAAAVHDWAVENAVNDFKALGSKSAEQNAEVAKAETEKLEKLWGPLDSKAMRTNLAFADKALREVGGEEALAEFQRVGLIGSDGAVIQSAPIAVMLSKLGAALYKEDDVVRGRADRLDNPFSEGKSFNVTAQMKMWKEDPDTALAFISAAGKQPSDFGLKSTAK